MSDKIIKNCTTCSDIDCNKKDVWCLKNKFISWKSKEYGDKLKAFYKKIEEQIYNSFSKECNPDD